MDYDQASWQLYELWFRLNRVYELIGEDSGLPQSHRYALYLLESAGPLTQRTMRTMTLWPKQTANAVVKALVERGWATLEPCSDDGRAKLVTLTDAGRAQAEALDAPVRAAERAALESLGATQVQALLDAQQAYATALERIAGEKEWTMERKTSWRR